MNVNNNQLVLKLISFENVKKSEDINKVTILANLNGAHYEFVVVEADIQKLSLEELQHKFGDQFTRMCQVAKVVHLKYGESLKETENILSLEGREGEMATHALSGNLKITLPKNLSSKKLVKINHIYQTKTNSSKKRKVKQKAETIPAERAKIQKRVKVEEVNSPSKVNEVQKKIVCEFSQGQLGKIREKLHLQNKTNDDDNMTSQACTFICMEAIKSHFDKGLPKNEDDIYHLINEGSVKYLKRKKDQAEAQAYFNDVYQLPENKISNDYHLYPLNLPIPEAFGSATFQNATEFTYPVNSEMSPVFEYIKTQVENSANKICAVVTTENLNSNATVLIMFDKDQKPVLFNSHGETIEGIAEGASLKTFNDMEDLAIYIKKTFYKDQEGTFQLMLLQGVPS